FTAAWALAAGSGRPADPPPPDDKAKPAETVKVELHRLKNDALLKQAAAIYAKASQDYLAAARALAAAEILLREATEKADGPPEAKPRRHRRASREGRARGPEPTPGPPAPGDGAGGGGPRHKLRLVQARKALLDRVSAALDASQSAAVAFLNALDGLKPYA